MPDHCEIRVHRTLAELEAIAPAWRALWQSDPKATPFQSPAWLIPWARQFVQQELCTIAITTSGALIGVLPFYIYPDPQSGERRLLLLGAGTSDYLGGAFSPSCGPEQIAEALEVLRQQPGWRIANATQLHPGAHLLQAVRGSCADVYPTESCWRGPAVSIPSLPQKLRRNVMHHRNRAQRRGSLEFSLADEPSCLDAFEHLRRLHTEHWHQRGQEGVLADPRVVAWHREALPQLARDGILRLCVLQLAGEVIAVYYCLADPPGRESRTQYFYLPAYSPRHADLGPGTLLTAFAIERAAQEGIRTADLLRGDEPYKRDWHMEETATFGCNLSSALEPPVNALDPAA